MSSQELALFFCEGWDGQAREADDRCEIQCKAVRSHVAPLSWWEGHQEAQCKSQQEEEVVCYWSLSECLGGLLENCPILGLMFELGWFAGTGETSIVRTAN